MIAHGCGGIEPDYIYTDSIEAMNTSYINGIRLFDVDVRFSSDDKLIIRHDWTGVDLGQPELEYLRHLNKDDVSVDKYGHEQLPKEVLPTENEFKDILIHGKYHAISFQDIYLWWKMHTDTWIVLDVKENVIESYKYIVENYKDDKDFMDSIVVSLYDSKDMKNVLKLYSFKNRMLREHDVYPLDMKKFVNSCKECDVQAANINISFFNDRNLQYIKKLRKNNIKIYWAVENDREEYFKYFLNDGVISDWITEDSVVEMLRQ